jgi:hypothetical protein
MTKTEYELFAPTVPMIREWLQNQSSGRRVYRGGPESCDTCLVATIATDHGLGRVSVGIEFMFYGEELEHEAYLNSDVAELIYACIRWMNQRHRKTMTAAEVLALIDAAPVPV